MIEGLILIEGQSVSEETLRSESLATPSNWWSDVRLEPA